MQARKTSNSAEAVIRSKKIGCRINSMKALLVMVKNCRMNSGLPDGRRRLIS
jgi:hypothetical protein